MTSLYGSLIWLTATARAFPLANAKLAAIINRGAFIGVWVRAISVAQINGLKNFFQIFQAQRFYQIETCKILQSCLLRCPSANDKSLTWITFSNGIHKLIARHGWHHDVAEGSHFGRYIVNTIHIFEIVFWAGEFHRLIVKPSYHLCNKSADYSFVVYNMNVHSALILVKRYLSQLRNSNVKNYVINIEKGYKRIPSIKI